MKILFIAYYFEPFDGVGAKRISYWAKYLKQISNNINVCDVLTATEQEHEFKNIDNVYYVKDNKKSKFKAFFKVDVGITWIEDLKLFISNNIKKDYYDYVIITGNPFMHFFITKKLHKLGSKVILDFRDPFATNPRGAKKDTIFKKIKHNILKKIEYNFVRNAYKVITVNEYCAELIEGYSKYKNKFIIIDNGYEEEYFEKLVKKDRLESFELISTLNFSYAGKLYADRNPSNFLKVIKSDSSLRFFHIGDKSEYMSKSFSDSVSLGKKTYSETINILNSIDICLIFTSGFKFESTTKVFDYMALNKIIFIISEQEIRTGQLHNITKEYPHIFWSKNNEENIISEIKKIKEYKISTKFNSYNFSREYGLKKLLTIFNDD